MPSLLSFQRYLFQYLTEGIMGKIILELQYTSNTTFWSIMSPEGKAWTNGDIRRHIEWIKIRT